MTGLEAWGLNNLSDHFKYNITCACYVMTPGSSLSMHNTESPLQLNTQMFMYIQEAYYVHCVYKGNYSCIENTPVKTKQTGFQSWHVNTF